MVGLAARPAPLRRLTRGTAPVPPVHCGQCSGCSGSTSESGSASCCSSRSSPSSTPDRSASGSPARSLCSRCCTSSATPLPPARPAPRPRSRSTSWPATRRSAPQRPLSKARRALISIAGPGTQIIVSLAVLVGDGRRPDVDPPACTSRTPACAIWWAGPVIGLLNLIPVLPLDGGHLAMIGVEAVLRRSALREMAIISVVITIGAAVAISLAGHTGFIIFIAFLLISQLSLLQATSRKGRVGPRPSTWGVDGVSLLPGARPSPWQLAYQAVLAGEPNRRPAHHRRRPRPAVATQHAAVGAADRRPDGRAAGGRAHAARPTCRRATRTARPCWRRSCSPPARPSAPASTPPRRFDEHRTPLLATVVARAAARMGDPSNALLWVRAAADAADSSASTDRAAVAFVLDNAPELVALASRRRLPRGAHAADLNSWCLTPDVPTSELDELADAARTLDPAQRARQHHARDLTDLLIAVAHRVALRRFPPARRAGAASWVPRRPGCPSARPAPGPDSSPS